MSGKIRFDTEPKNSKIFIDNEYIGNSPLDISDVEPGEYNYRMSLENYNNFEGDVIVYNNKIIHITVDLNTDTESREYINISQIESSQEQKKNNQKAPESSEDKSEQPDKLDETIKTTKTKDRWIKTKEKSIYYNTGHTSITTSSQSPPQNQDNYPAVENVYANNNQKPIEVMTLMNHGPGTLFYILRDIHQRFTRTEEILEPEESRILYNVYEVRLRTDVPQTQYHLVEGRIIVGGASVPRKVYVENRPSLQPNETLKNFGINFDNKPANININVPGAQVFAADYTAAFTQNPLPPGQVATLIDFGTGLSMPFTIPQGFIFESFESFINMSTQITARNYFELVQGSNIFTLTNTFPLSARGNGLNQNINISFFSSSGIDPLGAPAGGRRILITLTNDDIANSTIGDAEFLVILRQLS